MKSGILSLFIQICNKFSALIIISEDFQQECSMQSYNSALREHQSPNMNPQKLSLICIEQAYFHRIQIKTIPCLYKLNVKLKKPIILSLHSLPVLKQLIDHSELMNLIFQMENIYQIKICASGYGIFNQKYQLQQVSSLFVIFAEYCKSIPLTLKKLTLQFPGWRTFDNDVITNLFKFVKRCESMQEFTLNMNHAMCLNQINYQQIQQNQRPQSEVEQQTFYGKLTFSVEQFELLMKYISQLLPRNHLNKLELRFGAWQCVNTSVLQILVEHMKKIYQTFKNIKILKIDLNGWGTGQYSSVQNQIKNQKLEQMFRAIQQFDSDNSELLQIDMRNWPKHFKISKYKQRFQYLCGSLKRKDDNNINTTNVWSMSGTNFYGSQLRGKVINRMKVQIKE